MKTLSFIFTISFLLGCTQNKKNVIFKETIQMDTLYAPITENQINCVNTSNGYKSRFGLKLSNFYVVKDKITVGSDSIGILVPYYIQSNFSNCYPSEINENILIIYNAKDRKTKTYDNLLFSDNRNVYQELKPNNNGFIIYSEQGNSSKLFSSIFISKNKIDSIQIESWGFDQYSKTFKFEDFNLDKLQVKFIDSLQQKLSN